MNIHQLLSEAVGLGGRVDYKENTVPRHYSVSWNPNHKPDGIDVTTYLQPLPGDQFLVCEYPTYDEKKSEYTVITHEGFPDPIQRWKSFADIRNAKRKAIFDVYAGMIAEMVELGYRAEYDVDAADRIYFTGETLPDVTLIMRKDPIYLDLHMRNTHAYNVLHSDVPEIVRASLVFHARVKDLCR